MLDLELCWHSEYSKGVIGQLRSFIACEYPGSKGSITYQSLYKFYESERFLTELMGHMSLAKTIYIHGYEFIGTVPHEEYEGIEKHNYILKYILTSNELVKMINRMKKLKSL